MARTIFFIARYCLFENVKLNYVSLKRSILISVNKDLSENVEQKVQRGR